MVYTLRIDNNGNGLASGITVTDDVPDHTTFNAVQAAVDGLATIRMAEAAWTGDPGSTCTISLADLAGARSRLLILPSPSIIQFLAGRSG